MRYLLNCILSFFFVLHFSCTSSRNARASKIDDGKVELILIQVNDVYEIAPVSGGKSGGMARVATLKNEWLTYNRNTFLVMSGDFVSPSVYNSLTYEGKRIRGKQMIEAMNAAGTDLAIFGNHEFDITETELQERINESRFQWIASNTFQKKNGTIFPFQKQSSSDSSIIPQTLILTIADADGTVAKIGFIGITLPFNKADYVEYTDPLGTAEKFYSQIRDSCDAVVAITHQLIYDDINLARRIPTLAVILGGHEHDMQFQKTGNVLITKAHANAKSAYVIKLVLDKNKKAVHAIPELKMLDESISLDSATDAVVKKWTRIAHANYASLGFDANQVVIASGDSLDGRETETRTRPTNLTKIVVEAIRDACPDSDMAMMNAGSIRVDDILYPPVTQYDILRSLPFGGSIREAEIKGALLIQILEAGTRNKGTGGYLHYHPAVFDTTRNHWVLNENPIDTGKVYRVAFSEFLITGKETNLEFLNRDNPGMVRLYAPQTSTESAKSDIRLAIVRYLEKIKRN